MYLCNALGGPNKLLMKKYSRNNAKGTKRRIYFRHKSTAYIIICNHYQMFYNTNYHLTSSTIDKFHSYSIEYTCLNEDY